MCPEANQANIAARGRDWVTVGFGSLILILTLYFAYALLWSSLRQAQAAGFIPVSATVLASSVEESSMRIGSGGGSVRTFRPLIRYAYAVDGVNYESDRFHFTGPAWKDRDAALAAAARYPVGAPVTAHYDPSDPAVAVLDATLHPPPWPWSAGLLAILVVAVLIIRHGWKRKG